MNRLDKTIELSQAFETQIKAITEKQSWLVLTEGWCGDAAQIIPVLAKAAALNSNIDLTFLLRDENPGLMEQYLYKGRSKSIPKLIVVNEDAEELFNWGPRPAVAQELFESMKAEGASYDLIKEKIHGWYAKDKTLSIQKELAGLLAASTLK